MLKNVLLLGRPGSGKGTVAKKLLADFDMVHLSTGDLLRAELQSSTTSARATSIRSFMEKGLFVPDDIVISIVKDFMERRAKEGAKTHLLLDGFPRKFSQAQSMASFATVDLVIALDVPKETIVDRISKRWLHQPSGRIYNLDYSPPRTPGLDDVTGEKLIQRPDDTPAVVLQRLQQFDLENDKIIAYYKASGVTAVQSFAGTETNKIYPNVMRWVDGYCRRK